MDETTFHEIADILLESVVDAIEGADADNEAEIDYTNGILNIKLKSGDEYVINKHEPSCQIWVSSPFSGAHHFEYDETDDEWVSTRGKQNFKELISMEFEDNSNIDVEF
jgi:frataxin